MIKSNNTISLQQKILTYQHFIDRLNTLYHNINISARPFYRDAVDLELSKLRVSIPKSEPTILREFCLKFRILE